MELLDFYGSFYGCISLSEVVFPDDSHIKTINAGTFGYTAIKKFIVPASCVLIVGETFLNTNVEWFSVEEGNTEYKEYNGSVFNYDLTALILHRKSGELSLPSTTTSITDIAFSAFKGDIKLNKRIESFEKIAFLSYSGKRITIYGKIKYIEPRMFESCINLIEVKFYNEVSIVKENSFVYCNHLRRVVFLYPVDSIVETAFPDINKICFYGDVSAIQALLPNSHIKECKIYFSTCKISRAKRNNANSLLMVYY